MYVITAINGTTPTVFLQSVNTLSGGILGFGFSIAILIVLFFTYMQNGYTAKSSAAASVFITTILSIFLFIIGLLSWSVLTAYIIITALMTMLVVVK